MIRIRISYLCLKRPSIKSKPRVRSPVDMSTLCLQGWFHAIKWGRKNMTERCPYPGPKTERLGHQLTTFFKSHTKESNESKKHQLSQNIPNYPKLKHNLLTFHPWNSHQHQDQVFSGSPSRLACASLSSPNLGHWASIRLYHNLRFFVWYETNIAGKSLTQYSAGK